MARFSPSSALAMVPSKRGGGGGMPIASGARGVPTASPVVTRGTRVRDNDLFECRNLSPPTGVDPKRQCDQLARNDNGF